MGCVETDRSILADNALDQADDLGLGAVDGTVGIIFRQEPNLPVPAAQTLDRGFVPQKGHHDLPVLGGLLGADHNRIPAEDPRTDHAVAPDPEAEAARFPVPGHGSLLILDGQDGNAGGDHAHNGDLPQAGAGDQRPLAALAIGRLDEAALPQLLDVVADGGGGVQTHGGANLPDGGCVAVLLDELIDIIENQLGFVTGPGHRNTSPVRNDCYYNSTYDREKEGEFFSEGHFLSGDIDWPEEGRAMEETERSGLWNRVLGLPEGRELEKLLAWEEQTRLACRALTRQGYPAGPLTARAQAHYRCLAGLYRMLTGQMPPGKAGGKAPELGPGFWNRCYGRCVALARAYEARQQWQDYGPVFAMLAREQWEQARELLALLGTLRP